MLPIIQQGPQLPTPEALVEQLQGEPDVVLLRSALVDPARSRYSYVAARPFMTFRSFAARCELRQRETRGHEPCIKVQYGNPWAVLESLMQRFALADLCALPVPLGGCFGFWGYDLKNFVEPKLPHKRRTALPLPDCHVGFYDSVVAFDHLLGQTWIVSTGLCPDGSQSEGRACDKLVFWQKQLSTALSSQPSERAFTVRCQAGAIESSLSRAAFIEAVVRAKHYIRAGDIYQVNLAQRLAARWPEGGWGLFKRLMAVSPAPYAAYVQCGEFQLAGSSPELFLRICGDHVQTRPIKGTRPRTGNAERDAALAEELQASPKETAELVMITDLLRNDLGKVCKFGSVTVPELMRLERFAQVQHLVSTVEGCLRPGVSHLGTLAACFPGGSVTGAPKFRAMEIIDELEPVRRGPYTGALGYLGFNRQSQLSIIIRTAICHNKTAYFHVGAGIVADSAPDSEYDETIAKATGFLLALQAADGHEINASAQVELPQAVGAKA